MSSYSVPDPRKWHYEPETGEFYPIREWFDNGTFTYDRTRYVDRYVAWKRCASKMTGWRIGGAFFAYIYFRICFLSDLEAPVIALLSLLFGPIILSAVVEEYKYQKLKSDVGPEPQPYIPPSPVDQQPQVPVNASDPYNAPLT